MTTWLPIEGYEGLYEVSDGGQVRSLDRWVNGPHGTRRLRRGCVRKPALSTNGYLTVPLSRNGKPSTRCVHQLVAQAFLGPCPEGQEILHGPGGRSDNSVANLSYGTPVQNIAERDRDGYGATRTMNETLVREIRSLHASGSSYEEIAAKYGITKPWVYRIVRRIAWKNVS